MPKLKASGFCTFVWTKRNCVSKIIFIYAIQLQMMITLPTLVTCAYLLLYLLEAQDIRMSMLKMLWRMFEYTGDQIFSSHLCAIQHGRKLKIRLVSHLIIDMVSQLNFLKKTKENHRSYNNKSNLTRSTMLDVFDWMTKTEFTARS